MPDEPDSLAKKAGAKLRSSIGAETVDKAVSAFHKGKAGAQRAVASVEKPYVRAVEATPYGVVLRSQQAPSVDGSLMDKAKHVVGGSFLAQRDHEVFKMERQELVDRATAALEEGRTDEGYALQLRILQEEAADAERMGDDKRRMEALTRAQKLAQKMMSSGK